MLNIFISCAFIVGIVKTWNELLIWVIFLSIIILFNRSEIIIFKISFLGQIDQIRWSLIFLTLWITILCILRRYKEKENKKRYLYSLLFSIILTLLISCFYVQDYFIFYILFEASIIPIIFLILGWGYQPEKFRASVYIFIYTIFGSLPLLFFIIYIIKNNGNSLILNNSNCSQILWIAIVIAFLIKFPIYPSHLWLLKAHLEAPVAGSIILAGILLKLGGYGILRLSASFSRTLFYLQDLIIFLSLIGRALMAINCLRETNIKLLIAKSSVVHIGPCVARVVSCSSINISGLIGIIIAHGLCSSGLFYLADINYNISNSRSIIINKGIINYTPSISLFWFLILIINRSAPPSLALIREISIFLGLNIMSVYNIIIIGLISFFSTGYNIYIFSSTQHGIRYSTIGYFNNPLLINLLILFLHWLPANLLILILFVYS